MLDAFPPFLAFEGKERLGLAFGNRGQLEKIACDDQLWTICVKSTPQIQGQRKHACMPPNGRLVPFRML